MSSIINKNRWLPLYRVTFTLLMVLLIITMSWSCKDTYARKSNINKEQALKHKLHTSPLLSNRIFKKDKIEDFKKATRQQAIVLLHGLNRVSYDFNIMQTVLKAQFPHATVVALKSLNKDTTKKGFDVFAPTMRFSIKDQAEKTYKELIHLLNCDKEVILIGHSQGGLRGFELIRTYGEQLTNKHNIHIKHLITIGTPWMGAPIMNHYHNPCEIKKKLNEVEYILSRIKEGFDEKLSNHIFKHSLVKNFPFVYKLLKGRKLCLAGILDLDPESDFIRYDVALGLRTISVPITAIAGVSIDFSKLFELFPSSIQQRELQQLNAIYAEIIGGDPKCQHDMLLPVSTQHAEALIKKNFKCICVNGTCHGNKVGFPVKKGLPQLSNKKVIQHIIADIEAIFYEQDTDR